MENQHQKIKGYRELDQQEIDLMNEIKQKGEELNDLLQKIGSHLQEQGILAKITDNDGAEEQRLFNAQPMRWYAMARTDFQTGLMALTRAVAQPTTF